jgi:hypothetical protein
VVEYAVQLRVKSKESESKEKAEELEQSLIQLLEGYPDVEVIETEVFDF